MKASPGGVAGVFFGVLALAGGLGWLLYETGGETEPEPENGPATAPNRLGPARRVHTTEEPPGELPLGPHDQRKKPIPNEGRLRFEFEGHPDLALRDWSEVASAYKAMAAMFIEVMEKGVPTPEEKDRRERMFKTTERFQQEAVARPPGSLNIPRNTPPEHPAYAVNLIAVTLEQASLPLTDAQSKRLVELAKARGPLFDAAREAGDTPDPAAWALERLAEPATVLDSFFGEVNGTLTQAQSAALLPEVLRNRTRADFFSAAPAWGPLAEPIPFTTDEDLAEAITSGLTSRFGLPDRRTEVRKVVGTWLATFSPDVPDALDRRGFIRTQFVSRAVPRMVDLLKQLVDQLELHDEAAAAARQWQRAYVPMRR